MGIQASLTSLDTVMDGGRPGASCLLISRVGIGTAPIGSRPGEWWVNWGQQDDADSLRAIQAAVDGGINWVDTAPFYGWGHAEEVVGRALGGREDVLVFTKCGTLRRDDGDDFMDLSPESIRRGCEESLRRLGREQLDLLQFHDPDPNVPIEESWGALQELVAEGKVRHGGLSNHPPELVKRAFSVGPVAALQFHSIRRSPATTSRSCSRTRCSTSSASSSGRRSRAASSPTASRSTRSPMTTSGTRIPSRSWALSRRTRSSARAAVAA